jgi:multidrug efflux pump subunit AcrA (membrane-fusion protein)
VFVVKDGRVQVREVEAGFRALNEVEIVSGLKQGEFVIVEQVDLFRDGDRVRVGDLGGK